MKELQTYIRAGYSCVFFTTHEEVRAEAEIAKVARDVGYSLYAWDIINGVMSVESGAQIGDTQDPVSMIGWLSDDAPEKVVLVCKDLHPWLGDGAEPSLVARLKTAIRKCAATQKVMVIVGYKAAIPPEVERMCAVVEFQLPDRDTMRAVLSGVAGESFKQMGEREVNEVLDAARGMTTQEAENSFAISLVTERKVVPKVVADEKVKVVRKTGILTIEDFHVPLERIGGLDLLKGYLLRKSSSFSREAREYGLDAPRGVLVAGQPGTGKTLCSRAASSIFRVPQLSLNAGDLFDSLVGGSEGKWRTAFRTAKACAPCVLRIDEIDGLFSGGASSGQTDGGTTSRVLKQILIDMQDNSEGIFYFFTCNDINVLPDPLLSRVDVFYVEVPNRTERESIWDIHIRKRKRDPKKLKLDLAELARASNGFCGREIEQLVLTAMESAFIDGKREMRMADLMAAINGTIPASALTRDIAAQRRDRLAGKARPASNPDPDAGAAAQTQGRKINIPNGA